MIKKIFIIFFFYILLFQIEAEKYKKAEAYPFGTFGSLGSSSYNKEVIKKYYKNFKHLDFETDDYGMPIEICILSDFKGYCAEWFQNSLSKVNKLNEKKLLSAPDNEKYRKRALNTRLWITIPLSLYGENKNFDYDLEKQAFIFEALKGYDYNIRDVVGIYLGSEFGFMLRIKKKKAEKILDRVKIASALVIFKYEKVEYNLNTVRPEHLYDVTIKLEQINICLGCNYADNFKKYKYKAKLIKIGDKEENAGSEEVEEDLNAKQILKDLENGKYVPRRKIIKVLQELITFSDEEKNNKTVEEELKMKSSPYENWSEDEKITFLKKKGITKTDRIKILQSMGKITKVFSKDGSVYVGKIIDFNDTHIKIATVLGIISFPRAQIAKEKKVDAKKEIK